MRLPDLPPRAPASRGFSLAELLVVLAIVGVLAALLLPAVNRAFDTARDTKCQSNMRQIWLGLMAYRTDHDGTLPKTWDGANYWFNLLVGPRVGNSYPNGYVSQAVLFCPAGKYDHVGMNLSVPVGYAMTDLMVWYPAPAYRTDTYPSFYRNLRKSRDWPLLCDADTPQVTDLDNPTAMAAKASRFTVRHRGCANVMMVDGHVEKARYGTTIWTQQKLNDGTYY